jgi:hypothetical protein
MRFAKVPASAFAVASYTEATADGVLVVDYGADRRPIGIEITAPQAVRLERLNQLLADLGEKPLAAEEYEAHRVA